MVRHVAHWFVSTAAGRLWQHMLESGEFADWLPPQSAEIGSAELGRWLGAAQAQRLAKARLFYLEPAASELCLQAGADHRVGNRFVDCMPPTRYGMLVCPGGIGYSHDGLQLVAAHWGPTEQGWWVSWWCDTREYFEWLVTEHGVAREEFPELVRKMGWLHYIHSGCVSILEGDAAQQQIAEGSEYVTAQGMEIIAPELIGAVSSLVGAWALLASNAIQIENVAPPSEVTAQDRQRGVLPSKITRGYLAGTRDPHRPWDYDAGPVS